VFKLVVCDLDGTLLDGEHRLGDYSRAVLSRLRETGPIAMLASGRHFQDIRVLSDQLGGRGCLISCNGAAVHDRQARAIQRAAIEPECIDFLIGDPVFAQAHINVYTSEDWLVARPEPSLLQYHRDSGFAYRVSDLRSLDRADVLKVFYYGDPQRLQRLEEAIVERFGGRLSTTFSLPVTLEVMAAGVSKGAALARVAERLGIGLDAVLAFGDGMNDLEMLALAGKGILMENADPRLKEALPHLERIGTNRDQSVARWLESNLLAG
jgi:Cof subfamily protein (haloacid dehalogenase superfamily)